MTRADINEAKRRLPLRELMKQLGFGGQAKKNARCPFHHPDKNPSFSVWQAPDGAWLWKCHTGCGDGDEIAFLVKRYNLSFPKAAQLYLEMTGVEDSDRKPKQPVITAPQSVNGATSSKGAGASGTPAVQVRPLGDILDSICGFLRRYVIFQFPEQVIVCALWAAHTWFIDAFQFTPYVHVFSTEKRSGKSRLLDVLELFVKGPWRASGESEAVLFRKIDRDKPTVLYDEIDTIFSGKKNDGMESTRRMFNLGFTRGNRVSRCVGQNTNFKIQEFEIFCPKVLCGIGRCLPDTVADRALPIELQRQSRDEKAERFRKREAEAITGAIRPELELLSQQTALIDNLRAARPSLPDELSDRQWDICEPLLAIAEMAEGDWPETARAALVKLCAQEEDGSIRVKLLGDIRAVFDANNVDRLTTEEILDQLTKIEESPWALMWADDLKFGNVTKAACRLSRMLKGYKRPDGERLKPVTIRTGNKTPKGFHRSDFEEAWKRYLPPAPEKAATVATSATDDRGNVAAVADVAAPW
jgi:hypothetical protein